MRRYFLDLLNSFLGLCGVRVETLTRERSETRRLDDLARKGQFERPVYGAFRPELLTDFTQLMRTIDKQKSSFAKFCAPSLNSVGYSFDNDYFSSPDTEVLYTLIGTYRPKRIVEVGSGNSTKVMLQSVRDYELDTQIVSVDPHSRVDVTHLADVVHRSCVEDLDAAQVASWLEPNDILFIDSSHLIAIGSDIPFLYFHVLPRLRPGVLVHIHDIFLPYEYPKDWIVDYKWGFNEQILLNAILIWSDTFSILWPGFYLQKSNPEFSSSFPYSKGRRAQSFWLLKKR
jgi:hypothetical protein